MQLEIQPAEKITVREEFVNPLPFVTKTYCSFQRRFNLVCNDKELGTGQYLVADRKLANLSKRRDFSG